MEFDLVEIRKRVSRIDELRFKRALQDSPKSFAKVLHLLPALFHFNHPKLPGFTGNCPWGISNFSLNADQIHYLKKYFPTFNARKYANLVNKDPILLGIYSMGSVGTIAQTPKSDLDIWLCTKNNLSRLESYYLNQKIAKIKEWAWKYKVNISFYIINQQRFTQQSSTSFSAENDNCGSAQNLILLEEFYRSVIRLAGKPILWLHIPSQDCVEYHAIIQNMMMDGELNLDDWVDFGCLENLSINEYFGATLWQLYKCINSPYKSALKILLLESYFADFPKGKLISQEFKTRIFDNQLDFHFDAYQSILERVKVYLSNRQDWQRLNFAYKCFYLKIIDNYPKVLNKHHAPRRSNWRLDILKKLNSQWSWDYKSTKFLEEHSQWKIKSVKQDNDDLLDYIMISYRKLLQFMHQNDLNYIGNNQNLNPLPSCDDYPCYQKHRRIYSTEKNNLNHQDLAILSRKLYTAFEKLPEKVTIFSSMDFNNLAEKDLTIAEVNNNPIHKQGWYLITSAPNIQVLNQFRHCEYSDTLPKLIAWAYFNGILTNKTKLHLFSQNVSNNAFQRFTRDLRNFFPEKIIEPRKNALTEPCKISRMFIAINLTQPQDGACENKKHTARADLFNITALNSIIYSIDAVYRNYWGEIRTLHFVGQNALTELLKVLTKKVPKHSSSLKELQIYNYSENSHRGLHKAVEDVVYKLLGFKQPQNYLINNSILRTQKYSWKELFSSGEIASVNDYPHEIENFASEGFLQFFFEDNVDGSFNIYILDEKNNIEIYTHCLESKNEKILQINQLYQKAGLNSGDNPYKIVKRNFNYPQFYQLQIENKKVYITPFKY